MRTATVVAFVCATTWVQTLAGQTLVESSAAAAGGAVGGVAGKKVSDALTNIFEKVDKTTRKAAREESPRRNPNGPLLDVGPGVPHARPAESSAAAGTPVTSSAPRRERAARENADAETVRHARSGVPNVPPPPPLAGHRTRRPPAPPREPVVEAEPVLDPPPPPPPTATAADLKKIAVGQPREALVRLGFPAIHITMYDNGHLIETFRFVSDASIVGVVSITDGSVSAVKVN